MIVGKKKNQSIAIPYLIWHITRADTYPKTKYLPNAENLRTVTMKWLLNLLPKIAGLKTQTCPLEKENFILSKRQIIEANLALRWARAWVDQCDFINYNQLTVRPNNQKKNFCINRSSVYTPYFFILQIE